MALLMGRMVMPSNAPQALFVHGLARALELFPPTRRLFGELEIKPVNGSRTGLFRARPGDRLRPGSAFGQGLVAHGGQVRPSDEVLGDGLCLVGFGVDPARALSQQSRAEWQAAGGRSVQLTHRGQQLNLGSQAERCEDLGGRFLGASQSLGWAAVVRPDRMVLCEGPAADSGRLVEESLALLGVPQGQAITQQQETV
jgi:3-(3-hydroxy-phenyl)propionate hydroxylase